MKKQSMFYTDNQGRTRYIGNSGQKQVTAQVKAMETAPMRKKAGSFITNEDGRVIFIGGPGSGGGSTSIGQSGNIIIKSDLTDKEYINMRLWQDENIDTGNVPVYFAERDLPPVPEGHVRVFHGTPPYNAESIAKTGLKPGSETGQGERIGEILGVGGSPSSFGSLNVFVDVPREQVNYLSRGEKPWVGLYQSFPPERLGFFVHDMSTRDIPRLIEIYRERDPNFGKG